MRKLLCILLALTIVGPLFAGGKQEPVVEEEAAAVEEFPEDWAEVTKTLPKKYKGTTLNVLTVSGASWELLEEISEEFEEATGIDLVYTRHGVDDLYSKQALELTQQSSSFDLVHTAYTWNADFGPHFADLKELARLVPEAPPLRMDYFPEKSVDIYGMHKDTLMGLPQMIAATVLLWNKEHFKDAGLDPEKPPASWEELYEFGKKLTSPPDRYGMGSPAGNDSQTAIMWILLFKAFGGGDYFEADLTPRMNNRASIKAVKWMVEQLKEIGPPDRDTWGFPEMMNAFASGQSSMTLFWNGAIPVLNNPDKSTVVGKFGVTTFPKATLLGGWGTHINKYSTKKEAAYLFFAWYYSPEILKKMAEVGYVNSKAADDPGIIAKFPYAKIVYDALDNAVRFPSPKEQEVQFIIQANINLAVAGEKTAVQAVEDIQQEVIELYKEYGLIAE